jgi:hypothetical protein
MQLDTVQIGYGPIVHTRVGPVQQVISLTFRRDFLGGVALLSRPNIQIDEMLLALVDKRCHSSVIQVLESTADKRKPLTCKVLNRCCEIEFAIEPGLDCVLIRRL